MHRQMKKDREKTVTMAPVLYRQKVPNKPKEMLVSLMRHYQNSFQDTGKQDAINLFLGFFKPSLDENAPHIWDLSSDYYLHNHTLDQAPDNIGRPAFSDDSWYRDPIMEFEKNLVSSEGALMQEAEYTDRKLTSEELSFAEMYAPTTLTLFDELQEDDLHRVKAIRVSGVKQEMGKSFTQRLRETLPKITRTQPLPKSTISSDKHATVNVGTDEVDGDERLANSLWKALAVPTELAEYDKKLQSLMSVYVSMFKSSVLPHISDDVWPYEPRSDQTKGHARVPSFGVDVASSATADHGVSQPSSATTTGKALFADTALLSLENITIPNANQMSTEGNVDGRYVGQSTPVTPVRGQSGMGSRRYGVQNFCSPNLTIVVFKLVTIHCFWYAGLICCAPTIITISFAVVAEYLTDSNRWAEKTYHSIHSSIHMH